MTITSVSFTQLGSCQVSHINNKVRQTSTHILCCYFTPRDAMHLSFSEQFLFDMAHIPCSTCGWVNMGIFSFGTTNGEKMMCLAHSTAVHVQVHVITEYSAILRRRSCHVYKNTVENGKVKSIKNYAHNDKILWRIGDINIKSFG